MTSLNPPRSLPDQPQTPPSCAVPDAAVQASETSQAVAPQARHGQTPVPLAVYAPATYPPAPGFQPSVPHSVAVTSPVPPTYVTAPGYVIVQQQELTCNVDPGLVAETLRYVFYAFDIAFGIMMWAKIASEFNKTYDYESEYGSTHLEKCYFFDSNYRAGDDSSEGSSFCSWAIRLGIIATCVLIAMVVWHSIRYLNSRLWSLPFLVEGFVFFALSILWFVLAIMATTKPAMDPGDFPAKLNVVISGGYMAGFTHLFSAILALLQHRMGWDLSKKQPEDSKVTGNVMNQPARMTSSPVIQISLPTECISPAQQAIAPSTS